MCETLVGGEVLCCLSFLRGIGNQVTKAKKEGEDAHFSYTVIQRDFEKKNIEDDCFLLPVLENFLF